MPRGPKGEKRPADVIGNAIRVAKIATGEMAETPPPKPGPSKGGQKGGPARAESLSPARRKEIARRAASTRWKR